jgi:hypothetical protein
MNLTMRKMVLLIKGYMSQIYSIIIIPKIRKANMISIQTTDNPIKMRNFKCG